MGTTKVWLKSLLLILLFPQIAFAQTEIMLTEGFEGLMGVSQGWREFADIPFLINLIISLLLATGLSAVIGFHPRTYGKLGSPSQLEKPKAYIVYGVIGAVIGTLVLKYGAVVGLVIFGIGGLLRFRTNLVSPLMTGNAILVTLIGLCCGMNLPHVAVVVTAFVFLLTFLLERHEVFRIVIKGLEPEELPQTADAYRQILKDNGCAIAGEAKNFIKQEVSFVFSSEERDARTTLEREFAAKVPKAIRGSVDWNSG